MEAQYGEILRQHGNVSWYLLKKALYSRSPPLDITDGVLKQWILKYRLPPDAIQILGAKDLEQRYGKAIRHLAADNCTGYKLQAALKKLRPPLYASDQAAKDWLRKYGAAVYIVQGNSAGHLEMNVGKRIREDDEAKMLDAEGLKKWLYTSAHISASAKVCQTWLSKEWSSSGGLLDPVSVEEELGDRLRLAEYACRFASDDIARGMSEDLAE